MKGLQRYLKKLPALLILRAKHDNCYFLINSEEDIINAAKKVFDWNKHYYPDNSDWISIKNKIDSVDPFAFVRRTFADLACSDPVSAAGQIAFVGRRSRSCFDSCPAASVAAPAS